jgi:glutaredoxin
MYDIYMNNYIIKAILLEGCPYSNSANSLLDIHSLSVEKTWVNQSNKEHYKTNEINTFPQLYLKKFNNKGSILLGGYQELSDFVSTFLKQKYSDDNVNHWMNKLNWSKKAVLRMIQLVNKISLE